MILRKLYQQLLRKAQSTSYSFANMVTFTSPLSSSAQTALIAYFALTYIKDFDPNSYLNGTFSIRDNLLLRTVFNGFICKTIDDHLKRANASLNKPTEEWVRQNLHESSYQQVLNGFQIAKGVEFDERLYNIFSRSKAEQRKKQQQNKYFRNSPHLLNQRSTKTSKNPNSAVLNPTTITSIFFQNILSQHNVVLQSRPKIGMTTSQLTYSFLLSKIMNFRAQQSSRQLAQIVNKQQFQKIPIICKIKLSQIIDYNTFFMKIYPLLHLIYDTNQIQARFQIKSIKKKTKTQLKKFLSVISERAKCKKILVKCVFEQAETLSILLNYLQNMINLKQQWQKTDTFKRLRFLGDLISLITEEKDSKFDAVIFMKRQTNKQFPNTFDPQIRKQLKIIDILTIKNLFQNKDIDESQQNRGSLTFNLQLYNIFWFQLLNFYHYSKKLNIFLLNNSSYFQQIFKKAFKLDKINSLSTLNDINRWNSQITFFYINQAINHDEILEKIQRSINKMSLLLQKQSNISKESKEQTCKFQLIKLKNLIEQSKVQPIKAILIDSITQYREQSMRTKKYLDFLQFQKEVVNKIVQSENKDNKQHYSLYRCELLSLQHKQKFIQAVGCGEVIQATKEMKLYINPRILFNLLQSVKYSYDYLRLYNQNIYTFWTAGKIDTTNINLLDKIINYASYFLKKTYAILIKKIVKIQQKLDKRWEYLDIISNQFYNLLSQIPLQRTQLLNQQNLPIINFDMFQSEQLISENGYGRDYYVAGFPIKLYENYNQQQKAYDNNFGFDKIAVMNKDSKFQIILFNMTMGTVQSKLNHKNIEDIKNFYTRLNVNKDVDCRVIYMVPQYHYSDFLIEEESFSNLLQPFQINNKVSEKEVKVKVKIEVAYFTSQIPYLFDQYGRHYPFQSAKEYFGKIYSQIRKKKA